MHDFEFLFFRVDDNDMPAVVVGENFENLVAVRRNSVSRNPLAKRFDFALGQAVTFYVIFDRRLHSVNGNINWQLKQAEVFQKLCRDFSPTAFDVNAGECSTRARVYRMPPKPPFTAVSMAGSNQEESVALATLWFWNLAR